MWGAEELYTPLPLHRPVRATRHAVGLGKEPVRHSRISVARSPCSAADKPARLIAVKITQGILTEMLIDQLCSCCYRLRQHRGPQGRGSDGITGSIGGVQVTALDSHPVTAAEGREGKYQPAPASARIGFSVHFCYSVRLSHQLKTRRRKLLS